MKYLVWNSATPSSSSVSAPFVGATSFITPTNLAPLYCPEVNRDVISFAFSRHKTIH